MLKAVNFNISILFIFAFGSYCYITLINNVFIFLFIDALDFLSLVFGCISGLLQIIPSLPMFIM